ncbi:hypothetical protein I302_102270 [Kwoniella bestiolae CBS 10118]|uniref:BHLH domain-containing protein n=1 Tax=Kwoniella bestiolae CBS 10118 TaxID=1296100 RepID=A0A1B9GEL6_9TREE|nr:hypothetical protein I302_00962 [Kwoniella bestiolae CBS 10118]OCF29457.1 hypothetical protein I302_00962 [Kwoniella bestiolae CBS 10118]
MANLSPISGSPTSVISHPSLAPISVPTIPNKNQNTTSTKTTKSKPRKRVNTAEKRSQHNAIERARRETLNGKFLSLARLLPSLATVRRPSKSAIVNGSIAHLTHQREQRLLAAKIMKEMQTERDELLKEVNEWRKMNGYFPKELTNDHAEEIEQINSVEKESFGDWSAMDGDNDNDDQDQEEDDSPSTTDSFDTSKNIITQGNFTQVNGLITPRSSTDLDLALHQNLFQSTSPVDQRVQPQPAPTAGTGINWSTEFAFNLNQQLGNTPIATGQLNFGETPTHSSPVNIVSPSSEPTAHGMYPHHTPSPGSSHSSESIMTGMPNGWNTQQLAMLEQHAVQAHNIMREHQQNHQQLFNPIVGNSFNAMFQSTPTGSQTHGLSSFSDPAYAQQMLSNMFPRTDNSQVSIQDIQNAIRAGMGLGMGMNLGGSSPWTQAQA